MDPNADTYTLNEVEGRTGEDWEEMRIEVEEKMEEERGRIEDRSEEYSIRYNIIIIVYV